MKTISLLICSLLIFSCKKSEPDTEENIIIEESRPKTQNVHDKEALKDLVMKAYQWNENYVSEGLLNFKIHETDTLQMVLDMPKINHYLSLLKNTGYFTSRFVNKLDSVTSNLNRRIETGEILMMGGEIPPIPAAEFDAWCNCQDDLELEHIVVIVDKIEENKALLHWEWTYDGTDTSDWGTYDIEAVKQNGLWKIDYMKGFDERNYIYTE